MSDRPAWPVLGFGFRQANTFSVVHVPFWFILLLTAILPLRLRQRER